MKLDLPHAGTHMQNAHAHGTRMRTFTKKFPILGKSDPVGGPETRIFLVRPNDKRYHFDLSVLMGLVDIMLANFWPDLCTSCVDDVCKSTDRCVSS